MATPFIPRRSEFWFWIRFWNLSGTNYYSLVDERKAAPTRPRGCAEGFYRAIVSPCAATQWRAATRLPFSHQCMHIQLLSVPKTAYECTTYSVCFPYKNRPRIRTMKWRQIYVYITQRCHDCWTQCVRTDPCHSPFAVAVAGLVLWLPSQIRSVFLVMSFIHVVHSTFLGSWQRAVVCCP